MAIKLLLSFFIFVLGSVASVLYAKPIEIIYPPQQSTLDTRDADFIEILRVALEKTEVSDGPFIMRPAKIMMNPLRFRDELELGREPNIIWASVTQALEDRFLPIRIPLRKGILGHRVFLIRQADQAQFSEITTLQALKKKRVGQGTSWIDADILKANGFNVETGFSYEGLFKMLMLNRFDYFSRGINEIYVELQQRQNQYPEMAVEKTILLYYPLPKYFFVNKSNIQLADRIEQGLNIMIKDGTFDRIFVRYNQFYIDAVHLRSAESIYN
ncbi:transporter substrate-binding domain-containing protein [Vibrio sp. PP-XX7]